MNFETGLLSGRLKWLLVILAAVLIAALAYVVYQRNFKPTSEEITPATTGQSNETTAPSTTSRSPSSSTSESSTSTATDETANWKIYELKEFGFSFKYPGSWAVMDLEKIWPRGTIGDSIVVTETTNPNLRADYISNWSLGIAESTVDETIRALRDTRYTQKTTENVRMFGTTVTVAEDVDKNTGTAMRTTYVLGSKKQEFVIVVFGAGYSKSKDKADKITDSFKFTD